jgi:ubiquitin-protein ligase
MLQNEPLPNCWAEPIDNDLLLWQAIIVGPDDTPYEGGIFSLGIKFP